MFCRGTDLLADISDTPRNQRNASHNTIDGDYDQVQNNAANNDVHGTNDVVQVRGTRVGRHVKNCGAYSKLSMCCRSVLRGIQRGHR